MIAPYEFDNANIDGDKEAVIVPNPPTLVNKLSANETNNIKNKLNEVIEIVNAGGEPVEYLELRLWAKGQVAGIPNTLPTLEIGDRVHGFKDASTMWLDAIYNGGDPLDRASYTAVTEGAHEPVSFVAIATGVNQVFSPVPFTAGSVLKSRGELYKGTEWTQSGDEITILVSTNTGNTIYIKP